MSGNTRDTPSPESRYYPSHGLKLHYLDWGHAHLPPLILLHGIQDHARSWDCVALALRDRWHVLAPDMRGHGDSDWSQDGAYLPPFMLLDLVEFVDTLGFDTVTLVAHSFGGNAAARFAALYPERVDRLVLVDAMGPSRKAIEHWETLGALKRTRDWLEKRRTARDRHKLIPSVEDAARRLRRGNASLSEEQSLHLATHALRETDAGYVWKHDPLIGNFMPEDFAVHLSGFWQEILAPTLICWGTETWNPNPATDGSSDYFKEAAVSVFDKAGHWLHHDQPDEFVSRLKHFLTA